MPMIYSRWERYPTASREQFALAALNVCRLQRANGAQSSRYYWATANSVVILSDVPDGTPPPPQTPEGAKLMFDLSDLGERVAFEQWAPAGAGERTARMAGR